MTIPYVERTIRIKTHQAITDTHQDPLAGLPLREWKVEIWMLNTDGEEIAANIFEKCVYHLHPTFPNPIRVETRPPFTVEEQGWGEFSYPIQCSFLQGAGEVEFLHDLSFHAERYHSDIRIKVPIHIPELNEALAPSGPVPVLTDDTLVEKQIPGIERCIKALVASDEDKVTEIVNRILHYPSISREIEAIPSDESFVLDLRQLPDGLMEEVIEMCV
ncbi:LADA_0C07866g1_1 [Lachancea dasiensis]|uniref:LADA_0C07866g1_1 n=1 Tax=Lachancea dasiensis TaxID=1072105 RepID=A0A1G4IZQ3_9SACH|nr:LADA_0C07866g1_1 [Lachancea dasiensis]